MFACLIALACAQDAAAAPVWTGYPDQEAVRYDVTLSADFAARTLSGVAHITVQARVALDALRFDLDSGKGWQVDFAAADGAELRAIFGEHQVVVPLARSLPAGASVTVTARLSGVPVDGLEFAKSRYGETFLVADPFGTRTRGWLPCEDFVGDRAAWRLELTVPLAIEAIGAGEWREVRADAATRTFVGATRADIPPTLFAFAAGPWQRVAEDGDTRMIPHFVYSEDVEAARLGLCHHAAWMQKMESTFGPYLWEKFTTAQVPTRWGGVEYPGNVWLAESLYDHGDHGVDTLAHEFTHMWFGDGVGYAQWEHAWLSEGFASYFGPWLHEQAGGLPLRSAMSGARQAWRRDVRARRRPVIWKEYPFPDDLFMSSSSNTDQKGAWVLHMLRDEVGDAAFFGGIAAWYQTHRGTAVTTDSLRAAMDAAAGRDLGWFFAQWLEQPNCPLLRVTPTANGVTIAQEQPGAPYLFPLTLAWQDDQGQSQRARVRVEGTSTAVEITPGWHDLVLDPDVVLLFDQVR
jgi:aminopeptidase N